MKEVYNAPVFNLGEEMNYLEPKPETEMISFRIHKTQLVTVSELQNTNKVTRTQVLNAAIKLGLEALKKPI